MHTVRRAGLIYEGRSQRGQGGEGETYRRPPGGYRPGRKGGGSASRACAVDYTAGLIVAPPPHPSNPAPVHLARARRMPTSLPAACHPFFTATYRT